MKSIIITNHPLFDKNNFYNINCVLDYPKANNVLIDESILFDGWLFTKDDEEEILGIKIQTQNSEKDFSLNKERLDVKNKFFERENIAVNSICGFNFTVEYTEDFSLFIITNKKTIPWKSIHIIQNDKDFFNILKSVISRPYEIETQDKNELSNTSNKALDLIIESYFNSIKLIKKSDIDKLTFLNNIEKLYFNQFIEMNLEPHSIVSMVDSIKKYNAIFIRNPFCLGNSKLINNFIIDNVNYLQFCDEEGYSFYIIQYLHTIDAIYLPEKDLVFIPENSHFDFQHIKKIGYEVVKKINLNCPIIENEEIQFNGFLTNGISPYHFFYDCIPAFELLNNYDLLQKNDNIYSLNGQSYFPLSKHFEFDNEEKEVNSQDLNKILEEKRSFFLLIGSSYKNYSKSFIEEMDSKIVNNSNKLFHNTINQLKLNSADFIIWIGISSQKRSWNNQIEVINNVLKDLSLVFKNIVVFFDGMTSSIFNENNFASVVNEDNKIISTIKKELPENITSINLVNKTSGEKIYYSQFCHFFIANYSTGSMYPSRFLKKHGLTHLSNKMMEVIKNIHIHYNVITFPNEFIVDIPDKNNNRIDFISYTIDEKIFRKNVLQTIQNIPKKDLI